MILIQDYPDDKSDISHMTMVNDGKNSLLQFALVHFRQSLDKWVIDLIVHSELVRGFWYDYSYLTSMFKIWNASDGRRINPRISQDDREHESKKERKEKQR